MSSFDKMIKALDKQNEKDLEEIMNIIQQLAAERNILKETLNMISDGVVAPHLFARTVLDKLPELINKSLLSMKEK